MFFEGRKESREGHAHSVKTWRQVLSVEQTLCIRQKLMTEKNAGRFGKNFDRCTQLRDSIQVVDDTGDRSGGRFLTGLRGSRRSAHT